MYNTVVFSNLNGTSYIHFVYFVNLMIGTAYLAIGMVLAINSSGTCLFQFILALVNIFCMIAILIFASVTLDNARRMLVLLKDK